jgi:hypothetical protein
MKYFLKIILIIFCINNLFGEEPNIEIDNEVLNLEYEGINILIEITGTAIINSYKKNNLYFYELHVNPSLSELIIFDTINSSMTSYLFTYYFICENNSIVILKAPPHFSELKEWELYYNEELLDNTIILNGDIIFYERNKEVYIIEDGDEIYMIKEQEQE